MKYGHNKTKGFLLWLLGTMKNLSEAPGDNLGVILVVSGRYGVIYNK